MKRTKVKSNVKKRVTTHKKTVTKLKKELWRYFSTYIRNRDKFRCFTCDVYATGSGMHAGHFIPNSVGGLGLRYDETNVHAQCYNCNLNKSGNWVEYRERMIKTYGEEAVLSLERRRNEIVKDFNYEEKIAHYKAICKAMGY